MLLPFDETGRPVRRIAAHLPAVLSTAELARYLGVTEAEAISWCEDRELPARKLGRRFFIGRDAFIDWIEGYRDESPPSAERSLGS